MAGETTLMGAGHMPSGHPLAMPMSWHEPQQNDNKSS